MSNRDFIRVSEIAEFCFCRRSWFLSQQGIRPSLVQIEKRAAGIAEHHRHAQRVHFSQAFMSAVIYVLLLLCVLAIGYWLWAHAR